MADQLIVCGHGHYTVPRTLRIYSWPMMQSAAVSSFSWRLFAALH